MANENVKFYRGQKDDLPLKGENGAIYITNDSGDVYMDTQTTTSNASSGESVAGRVHLKDSTKAPINHASSSTTYGVSTASAYGHAKASSTTPKANGTASVGSETSSFARGDHVHPLQTSVANATKATQDSAGQQINKTYIKGLTVSGKVITYTKGDGSTGTITTQDTNTTYGAASSSALGLIKSGGDITVDGSGIVTVNNDSHTHSNSTITSLDASKLTGTVSIDRLPKGALERLVTVEDQSARFSLTTSNVQLGDTVQQLDTGVMYLVVNESELDNSAGYKEYTAGSATSVPWSGVTGKPSSFTPSTHTHTISQITDIKNASVASATKATQDSAGQTINSTYIKSLSVSGKTITYTKGNGTTGTVTTQDTNTTYSAFKGATSSAAGGQGLVPAPSAGDQAKFLKADGTWGTPSKATLSSLGITATATELNYMDGVTSNVQTQLNAKASTGHTHTKSQITDFPSSLKNPNALKFTGASTATYDGSSAVTVNIPTTQATPSSLVIKLNGGTTEGTNMFTFNGGSAKTVNITPSSIGAAPAAGSTSIKTLGQTVTFGSGAAATILQNSSNNQQKFEILDNNTSGDGAFRFSHSTNSGDSWVNLLEIRDDGNIVADQFTGSLSGNATTATTATKVGHSLTLQLNGTTKATFNGSASSTINITASSIGAAASSHNHSASNITSGTLAVERGGTGLTASPSLLVNLGSTSAASIFAASPRPGITGTLSVSHGGTGATDAASARTALGITPANIGAAASNHTHSYLPLSGGTLSGLLVMSKGSYVHYAGAEAGQSGYIDIATIKINGAWQDTPIKFEVFRRDNNKSTVLYLKFKGAEDADTSVDTFYYEGSGSSSDFAIVKSSTSTWHLFIKKTTAYDNIGIAEYATNFSYMSHFIITWTNTYAASLPSGAKTATLNNAASSTAGTLTVQFNGSTNKTFNGSSSQTVNITPSAIGAAASSHTHNYAGSSSAGGAATSAAKLNTNAGSATQPVYFTGGVPKACTYTLAKSVPSNAVFTDTKVTNTLNNTAKAYVTGTTSSSTNTGTQVFDNGVYLETTAGRFHVGSLTIGSAIFTYSSSGIAITWGD